MARPQHSLDFAAPHPRQNILAFVSRADHLARRQRLIQNRELVGRLTPDMGVSFARQDEAYRLVDFRWAWRHGPIPGGGRLVPFRRDSDTSNGEVHRD